MAHTFGKVRRWNEGAAIIVTTIKILILLALVSVIATCTPGSGSPPATKLTLDLSTSRSASIIPVTPKNPWVYDGLSILNTDASLKFPGGRSFQGHLFSISFDRRQGEIWDVMMNFEDSDLANTYALALKFAAGWGLSTVPIDEWHKALAAGRGNRVPVHTMDNAKVPACDLQILPSLDVTSSKPYRVIFELTWPR